jgi:hypothetical protein
MVTPIYSSKQVPAHGATDAPAVLINEAPGPQEDQAGLPCFGAQGGELYRALRHAGIPWATHNSEFSWPSKPLSQLDVDGLAREAARKEFLVERGRRLLVSNSYASWPRPANGKKNFCPPAPGDVLSPGSVQRLATDLAGRHQVLLIGVSMAYLACVGSVLITPAKREATQLQAHELLAANARLGASFESGWYMGHTRRWVGAAVGITQVLQSVARSVRWL